MRLSHKGESDIDWNEVFSLLFGNDYLRLGGSKSLHFSHKIKEFRSC